MDYLYPVVYLYRIYFQLFDTSCRHYYTLEGSEGESHLYLDSCNEILFLELFWIFVYDLSVYHKLCLIRVSLFYYLPVEKKITIIINYLL